MMKTKNEVLLTTAVLLTVSIAPLGANAEEAKPEEAKASEARSPIADLAAEHGGIAHWGEFEVGFRSYLWRQPRSAFPWQTPTSPANLNRNNDSKFEEYGNLPPGIFGEWLRLGAMTKDGSYGTEFTGENIGNNNQRYILDASKAGEHYFTAMWDQIPHLYNTSAQSIWNGVGTNFLTTPVSIPIGSATVLPTVAQMNAALAGKFNTIDIGIRRDKGTVAYRWTPDQNWDVRATYSNEKRSGTQQAGVVLTTNAAPGQQFQAPRPVDDTTQNAKLASQYFGPTPWGGHYNVNLAGGASLFENTWDSYTVQNPFYQPANAAVFPAFARVSLMPSNQAYNSTMTSGVDLPLKTRWNSTFQYMTMRQNEAFIPNTINTAINMPPVLGNPQPWTTAGLPASSLNGEINTILYNTLLTTQITPEWKSTVRYRFYDLDNQTPELLLPAYPIEDGSNTNATTGRTAYGMPRRALAYSYNKQNASEELQWRPWKWATLGTFVGWERWDRTHRDVNLTNEFIGKTSADFKIYDVAVLRSSVLYSERRYDKYDPVNNWFAAMFPIPNYVIPPNVNMVTPPINLYSPYQRQFDMANRDRRRANVSLDWTPFSVLTITPTAGAKFDDYRLNLNAGEVGLNKDHNWNAGIEGTVVLSPGNTVTLSYMHEIFDRKLYATTTAQSMFLPPGPRNGFLSDMHERVDTVMVSTNMELVPSTLDLKLSYAYSFGAEDWTAQNAPYTPVGTVPVVALCPGVTCLPFPTTSTNFQRADGTLRYTVDPQIVSKLGWIGEVFVKLRYVWERNSVNNWQQDLMSPYLYLIDTTYARMIEMGGTNPNYNVHRVQLSLAAKW
jgi:MtrB/PioB family decaheme-associated outer membrane protein